MAAHIKHLIRLHLKEQGASVDELATVDHMVDTNQMVALEVGFKGGIAGHVIECFEKHCARQTDVTGNMDLYIPFKIEDYVKPKKEKKEDK